MTNYKSEEHDTQIITTTIENLAFGGAGVARDSGKIVFVKGAVPGDLAEVEIYKEKKNFALGKISKLIEESPHRANPFCPVFQSCGGCQWQHIEYGFQKKSKEKIFEETLVRIGGCESLALPPIVSTGSYEAYRSRANLKVWHSKGHYQIGFFEEATNNPVAIESCPIVEPPMQRAIEKIAKTLSTMKSTNLPIAQINLATDGSEAYITLVPTLEANIGHLNKLVTHLQRFKETANISYSKNEIEFSITVNGLKLWLTPSIFSQANRAINEKMVETVMEWSDLKGTETVLELYSGAGNFTLHLAQKAGSIGAVEVSHKARKLAKKSARSNAITNVSFIDSSVEDFVINQAPRPGSIDLLVLDPPRTGAKEIVDFVITADIPRIIYISCDPATLARDIKLLGKKGYGIVKTRTFDMFPETYHIESITVLEKM